MPFIYSNTPGWRLLRHVSFWLTWFLFQLIIYSFSPSAPLQQQSFFNRILLTLPETAIYLLPSLILAYSLMYLVIPKMVLRGRYLLATISTIFLIICTAGFSAVLSITIIDYLRHRSAGQLSMPVSVEAHPPLYIQLGLAMLAGLRGGITVGGIAAAIKLMKCFYERQQAALTLEKEKVRAELLLLKAQLHPHFLFNTLNNIYSFAQADSPRTSNMILELSQLLRYMLYECNQPFVSLDLELKMIRDYIELERVRYGKGLDISMQMPVPGYNLAIAPLILLPFVENAFKHGASQMIEQPWISLTIDIRDKELSMKLINGKSGSRLLNAAGIGIANVGKRLDLLYPDQYKLDILEEEDVYIVNLKLALSVTSSILKNERNHESVENV